MAITVVGTLEADLPGAIEYKDGGVGPLFRASRTQEPISLLEFLNRTLAVLQSLGIRDAVTCYVDEVELFRDADDDERDDFDVIRGAAKDTINEESGVSFHLMLSHEDKQLSHILTVEASVDHPADEASLSVLDVARADAEFGGKLELPGGTEGADQDKDWGFASDAKEEQSEPLDPVDDDVTFLDERAADVEDLVDAFLQRVLAAFEKELGVAEPEIDVWTDWDGEYAAQTPTGGMPGMPGLAG